VLLEIKINGELASPLSVICHRWGVQGVRVDFVSCARGWG
jgi:hypothetical protein